MKNKFCLRFLVLGLLALAGCQQMDPTEYGVRFRKLPPSLGGGIASTLIRPGEVVALMPWDSVYTFDTKPQDVSWGSRNQHGERHTDTGQDFVYTRARDGNELALAFTVRYRVVPDPDKLATLIQEAATTDAGVRQLVISIGRSDIRRFMNELHTSEFLDTATRYQAVDNVRKAMQSRLSRFGIEVVQVNLDDYRFERKLKDGTIDASYQERLTEIQKLTEDTERERSRTETVKAKKAQELNAMMALKSQLEAEAIGYKNQSKLSADAYFESRSNEAKAILTQGQAEVSGMIQQISALQGAGGQALLRLEIAKQMQKGSPNFVVLNEGRGNGQDLQVKRLDTNQLLQQLGVMEGMRPSNEKKEIGVNENGKEK